MTDDEILVFEDVTRSLNSLIEECHVGLKHYLKKSPRKENRENILRIIEMLHIATGDYIENRRQKRCR